MIKTFRRSVAAIYVDNRRLILLLGRVRDYFVHGAVWPDGEPRLSAALRCEQNGAHRLLANLGSALKRMAPARPSPRIVEKWLALSSRRLLNELLSLAGLLPRECDALADQLRHAVNGAMTKEDEFTNYLLADSDDEFSDVTRFRLEVDAFIRALKDRFNAIASSVEDIEVSIERRRVRSRRTRRTVAPSSAAAILCSDRKAICAEVRRRCAAQRAKGRVTTLRTELDRLYRDEAWSRRCRQWRPDTLYTYLLRTK